MNDELQMIASPKPLPLETRQDKPLAMTSTQARVDAVAALTTSAVSRAGTLVLTPDETARLTADFADDDFRTGAAGKENLLYIEHAALRDRLNQVLGLGQSAIIVRETWNEDFTSPKGTKGVRVYCRAMMLVRGCYVGEAVGDMDYFPGNASQNYGDAFEGSKTAAFRRCAKEFGVGLQAWRKEWCDGWWLRRNARPSNAPATTPTPAPKPPAPTPRALTPDERKAKLFAALKGYEPEATTIFREEGMIFEGELFTDISSTRIELMSPDQMLALIKTVKMRKADSDQVPDAEVPDEPPEVSDNVRTGIVEATNEKTGTTKVGKPFTKYGVKIGENWHNHFSASLHAKATSLKDVPVVFTATVGQYGSTLETIEKQAV